SNLAAVISEVEVPLNRHHDGFGGVIREEVFARLHHVVIETTKKKLKVSMVKAQVTGRTIWTDPDIEEADAGVQLFRQRHKMVLVLGEISSKVRHGVMGAGNTELRQLQIAV